jgi:cell filamentation protein, protein adenylyltransferase
MKRRRTGKYVAVPTQGEPYRAFVPDPLPPVPPLSIDESLRGKLDSALLALGRLDSLASLLSDTSLVLYMYVRKEAVLSSQIEGTQSSLSDLLLYESDAMPGVPLEDVREVSSYVAAMEHGLRRIREGFPLSLRLIREIHGILLAKGRGSNKTPGEFRRSQNWIGGTRPGNAAFVPPPSDNVLDCMGHLDKFLNDKPVKTSSLLKAALAHVQFETIHPFLDGNGRLGRLLITLILCAEHVLGEPLLYLSLYFKTNRQTYYDLLQKVRTQGDWENWLGFFARGVSETAEGAVQTAKKITRMFADDRERIQSLGKPAGSALRVHQALTRNPLLTVPKVVQMTGLTFPTVTAALKHLEKLAIVCELTGKQRDRIFAYQHYIKILSEGTEPIR